MSYPCAKLRRGGNTGSTLVANGYTVPLLTEGAGQMGGAEQYVRVKVNNEWRSICTICYQTAATARTTEQVAEMETKHVCLGSLRERHEPITFQTKRRV